MSIASTTTSLREKEVDFSIVDALPPQYSSSDSTEEEDDEKSPLKDKKSRPKGDTMIPMSQMFIFSTPLDKLCMLIGTIAAICNGVALPLMTIIFAGFIDTFARFFFGLPYGKVMTKFVRKCPSKIPDKWLCRNLFQNVKGNLAEFCPEIVNVLPINLFCLYKSGIND